MRRYGVVQGRLLPQVGDHIQNFPFENWRDEFRIAKEIGCSHIEWSDRHPLQVEGQPMRINPIYRGLTSADDLEVSINALCIDSIMEPGVLHRELGRIACLVTAFSAVEELGILKIVIPLLEEASIRPLDRHAHIIDEILSLVEDTAVRVSFETDLEPREIGALVRMLTPGAGITLDTGNVVRLGHDLREHIDAAHQWIDNVHIKDCTVGGTTVQLGTGDVPLEALRELTQMPRLQHITFQTARSPGDERETFSHNCRIMEEILCS